MRSFWSCGDNEIIEFALMRARLNKKEKDVLYLLMDECMTQERAAEKLDLSTRRVQEIWYDAAGKLLRIPWVYAYAESIKKGN